MQSPINIKILFVAKNGLQSYLLITKAMTVNQSMPVHRTAHCNYYP